MTEVTAEMIERGRGMDPRVAAERRRMARRLREARDKLAGSGSGHPVFQLELFRLYAERRIAAAPGCLLLAAAFAFVVTRWTSAPAAAAWLGANALCVMCAVLIARRFLRSSETGQVGLRGWHRSFVAAETAQGLSWSFVIGFVGDAGTPHAASFLLVALLLMAAMSLTVTATVPAGVLGCLTPVAAAVVLVLRPTSLAGPELLLSVLALGTEAYFVVLGRKLHASLLQSMLFRAEKDELIAELEQAKTNSDLARRRAEESNLAKSRFLATMSHELRTPLNAILGFSEVMKAELFGAHAVAAYRDYSADIHSSGQHLLMLINEILDLSRVEAGRYELSEEPVDLPGVMDECRHLIGLRAKKKDIAIGQDGCAPLPRLWADARAIRQVVLNILSNAVKFTPAGGSIRIALGATNGGGLYFAVADTGVGIPESEIPTVMSSFGRGSFAQKTAEEGTGLGLPIVKGLIELHGGTFELKSRVREGTTVTVGFPPERVMSTLPPLDAVRPAGERAA